MIVYVVFARYATPLFSAFFICFHFFVNFFFQFRRLIEQLTSVLCCIAFLFWCEIAYNAKMKDEVTKLIIVDFASRKKKEKMKMVKQNFIFLARDCRQKRERSDGDDTIAAIITTEDDESS